MAKNASAAAFMLKKYFGIKKITQVENSKDFKISICSLFYFKIIDSNRCKIIKAKIPYTMYVKLPNKYQVVFFSLFFYLSLSLSDLDLSLSPNSNKYLSETGKCLNGKTCSKLFRKGINIER